MSNAPAKLVGGVLLFLGGMYATLDVWSFIGNRALVDTTEALVTTRDVLVARVVFVIFIVLTFFGAYTVLLCIRNIKGSRHAK